MNLSDFLKIPFKEGLKNFTDRYPILAKSSKELSERYSKENVFGLVKSTSLVITEFIQDYLVEANKTGETTERIHRVIQDKLNHKSKGYAETVFRTNLNAAYNAGRQRMAQDLPGVVGFEFSATRDPNTRHNHLAFYGMRAPKDHPVWIGTASPPLGYNCRCTIRAITKPEARAKGWLDKDGALVPHHPQLGDNFSMKELSGIGARADDENFGSRQFKDKWITIGAGEDKKGFPVQIDESGRIKKGGSSDWRGNTLKEAFTKTPTAEEKQTKEKEKGEQKRNDDVFYRKVEQIEDAFIDRIGDISSFLLDKYTPVGLVKLFNKKNDWGEQDRPAIMHELLTRIAGAGIGAFIVGMSATQLPLLATALIGSGTFSLLKDQIFKTIGKLGYSAEAIYYLPGEENHIDEDTLKFAGRWITIGAKDGDDDGEGGRKGKHIQIDEDGKILKGGPENWKGKHVSEPFKKEEASGSIEEKLRESEATPDTSPLSRKSGDPIADPAAASAHNSPERMDAAIAAQKAHPKDGEYWGKKEGNIYFRPGPNPTVDNIITRDGPNGKEILLIQRADKEGVAERGKWALPGGFHDTDVGKGEFWKEGKESAQQAALRELAEETGLDASTLEKNMSHVGFFDKPGRDPRDNKEAWAVSNAFSLHLPPDLASGKVQGLDDADNAEWVSVGNLKKMDMAFDHSDIIKKADIEPSSPIRAKTKSPEEMQKKSLQETKRKVNLTPGKIEINKLKSQGVSEDVARQLLKDSIELHPNPQKALDHINKSKDTLRALESVAADMGGGWIWSGKKP